MIQHVGCSHGLNNNDRENETATCTCVCSNFLSGKLRYANNSNYKNDTMIRKEVCFSEDYIKF